MHNVEDSFKQVYCQAEKECQGFERFPGYFKFKEAETLLVLSKSGLTGKGPVLEIGCGTGFQSALLSKYCDKIVSTDLPDFSRATHTIGIKNAREMTLRLGIGNVKHLGCSALELPFKDRAFSCVFSSGVLEHISDKNNALTEMRRVIKDNGIIICSVPTYMETIFQFPALYFYMVKRAYDVLRNKLLKKSIKQQRSIFFDNDTIDRRHGLGNRIKTFFQNNPSFPFPQPHGDWRDKNGRHSIFVEFSQQFPWRWKKMFLNSGLKVEKTFAVLFIPYSIIEIFSPWLLTEIYCNTQFLHRKIADSFLKYFSISICYVARKA